MNTEHVDVGPDFSDAQVGEIFLHHRVLLVPAAEHRRPIGVIIRSDFFRARAERFRSRQRLVVGVARSRARTAAVVRAGGGRGDVEQSGDEGRSCGPTRRLAS